VVMGFDYLWSPIGIGLDVVLDGRSQVLKDHRGDYEREAIEVLRQMGEMGFVQGKHYMVIHLPHQDDFREIVPRLRVHSDNPLGLESGNFQGRDVIVEYLEANKSQILGAA